MPAAGLNVALTNWKTAKWSLVGGSQPSLQSKLEAPCSLRDFNAANMRCHHFQWQKLDWLRSIFQKQEIYEPAFFITLDDGIEGTYPAGRVL